MSLHLEDERIDAMRTYVMGSVDLDVRRRGRRARRLVGGGLAACFVVVIAGVGIPAVTSGGGGTSSQISARTDEKPDLGDMTSASAGDLATEPSPSGRGATTAPDDRDVVTTGTVTATVRDVGGTIAALSAWLAAHDGRLDAQSRSGSGNSSSASLTVRVPSDQVDAAVEQVERNGRLDDVSIQREDVGTERRDLDARIDALRISVERLEQIMAEADRSSDLLAAEKSLSQRQAELESLQAQKRSLADRIDLSTIQVELSTRTSAQTPSDDGFTSGLVDGWNALVSVVSSLVLAVGFLLPWLGVLAAMVVAGALVRRRRRG